MLICEIYAIDIEEVCVSLHPPSLLKMYRNCISTLIHGRIPFFFIF